MSKVQVAKTNEFTLWIEQLGHQLFVHCDVHRKFTKGLARRLGERFEHLRALHQKSLFAVARYGDPKHYKFLRLYGFTRAYDRQSVDGTKYQIWATEHMASIKNKEPDNNGKPSTQPVRGRITATEPEPVVPS